MLVTHLANSKAVEANENNKSYFDYGLCFPTTHVHVMYRHSPPSQSDQPLQSHCHLEEASPELYLVAHSELLFPTEMFRILDRNLAVNILSYTESLLIQ